MKLVYAIFTAMAMFFTTGAFASTSHSNHHHALWVKKNATKPITMETARNIVDTTVNIADQYGFDPIMLLAIMKVESGFRPKVKNTYGAMGLMQVVPRFHKDKIGKANILNIKTNIKVGAQVLSDCFDRNNLFLERAVQCYNGGASAKYIKKLRVAYASIARHDVKMRFAKELPVYQTAKLTTGLTFEPIRRGAKTRVAML